MLLLVAGASRAWAADDTFTVTAETSTTRGSTIYTGIYTTLTLGFSTDNGTTANVFKLTNSNTTIGGEQNPHFNAGIPDGGHVFVLTTSQPGDFVFHVKLFTGKSMCLRNSSGVDIATKANSTNSPQDFEWKVSVESSGTYYFFAIESKVELFGYTFTKKPIQGITELPYSADFSSDTEPFEQTSGTVSSRSTTNVGQVLSVSATGTATPGIATAYFKGGYTPKQTETVTISFTAYHGWNNYDKSSTVDIRNTSGQSLVKYTYNQNSTLVTDVSFGGTTASGFEAFSGINKYNTTQNANGFAPGSKPYVSTAGYNPTITMTICGNGLVTFSFVCSGQSVSKSFSSNLEDIIIDLGSIVVTDAITHSSDQSDRAIGIDDLRITSQLYSSDYENTGGLIDWTTGTSGRYTPTIMEEAGGNHYMGVNQEQRYNNGATLTNTLIDGAASADEDFTLEFDMKIGRSNRNQSGTKFTVFDAANSELFSLTDEGTTDNRWKLAVVGGGAASNIDLPNTSTSTATDGTALAALDWYHYKLSYNDGVLYITITSRDGSTTYWRGGTTTSSAGGLKKMTFDTKRHYANFAFDNLTVSAYANTNYTVKGKVETYDIASGGDLRQVDEGKTIKIEYGDQWQVQQTKEKSGAYGAYCLDANKEGKYSRAWQAASPSDTAMPTIGIYYKLTPKFNGKLSISGWVDDETATGVVNNVTLQKSSDGSIVATYLPSNSNVFSNQLLDVELVADETYYLYASTPNTANCAESNTNYPTLFLSGFKFEQTSMNREIKVSDLLYINGKTQSDGLNREIPGFNLSFTGGSNVAVASEGTALTLTSGGTMTIAVRENGYSAKISNITLYVSSATSATVNSESITTTGKKSFTISPEAASVDIACTAGSLTITSFSVGYSGDDNNNTAMWLDDEKTMSPSLSFANKHIMRVPGDGQAFANGAPIVTPSSTSPYSFNGQYVYTSSVPTIATINSDGTGGQLLKSDQATITATFAETDYFLSASANYTVDNVLHTGGETYTRAVTSGYTVRIDAKAADAASDLTLTGASNGTLNFGTTVEKKLTSTNATTLTLTNNSSHNITIETLRVYAKRPVAYLYYAGQEGNYAEQVHFLNFASGPVTGFRVLDIGDPIEPIDLTAGYKLKTGEDVGYVWERPNYPTAETQDGSHVNFSNLGGTFSTTDGSFTAGYKATVDDEHPETRLPRVSHLLTKTGTGSLYDDYSDELTATADIYIATPPDKDTYHVWDMTTSVSAAGQMDSRWVWNSHGYYQTSLPEYLPVLNNTHTTLAGNEGLLVKGDLRYHTGTTGLRLNLTKTNGFLKFPVKAGMEVKIVMASATADITHVIKNVTDLTGDDTESLYIEYQGVNSPVTAYYLAKSDGAVEIRSMDRSGAYVKSVTLQVPRIHFAEEIVTVSAAAENYSITNLPYNTGDATLTYTIHAGSCTDLDGTAKADDYLAKIPTTTEGRFTVNGSNVTGHVTVDVVDNTVYASGIHPKKGSFELYVIDFRFDPTSFNKDTEINSVKEEPDLDLSSSEAKTQNGEAIFKRLPVGADKVVQPVTYTMSVVSGTPRGRIVQNTKSDPTQTTYTLTAYSPGTIRVTATTGRITTYCDVEISGGDNLYSEVAPSVRLTDLPTEGEPATRYYEIALPEGFDSAITKYEVDISGDVTCGGATTIDDSGTKKTKISNIAGNGGAIRVTATDNNGTVDTSDDKTAQFVLTIAYPASTGHKWDFYKMKHYTHDATTEFGLYIGKIDDYDGDDEQTAEPNPKTVTSHAATQRWSTDAPTWTNSWTTAVRWDKIYRKGKDLPRWSYYHSMRGYNAFIVEETAGLLIETGQKGFYIDNPHQPTETAYNHIGLHNNASVTIPKLKKDDYIVLNLCHVTSSSGSLISATNATDLAGTVINHNFSISHSQEEYSKGGVLAIDDSGARVIPGCYTFRAAADGDVTFTLADEGYLDILSIEIYNSGYATPIDAWRDNSNGYLSTMKAIVTDGDNLTPPATILKEDNSTRTIDLAICNVMWSTSVGPADYILLEQKGDMDATLENVEWTSDRGATYNKGRITVGAGYGNMSVRMNNYTAEGRYLIGYTPTYQLTVGHPPHQDYPFTWNFENISGGAVKNRGNNVYNSVRTDPYTWKGMGYETYQLDTRTGGGSLYVPGGTLVSSARDLGAKGTIDELNAANLGCDEFNGLGFNGQITYRLALQGSEEPATPVALNNNGSLLDYAISSSNYQAAADKPTSAETKQYWTAGDGLIKFGQTGKRVTSDIAAEGAAYQMDGGNSKNLLLKPERALKEGDVIYLKGYSTANVLRSGFSFYAGANDNAYDALTTINWKSSTSTAEQELTYTIKQGDGLAGRDSVYLFRADKQYTVFLTEIRITTTDEATPTIATRAITCNGDVTVTIPDLVLDHYVYIKSSTAPKTVPSNLTAAVTADGLDAATDVYKYKVIAAGNADVVFADGTKIYRIGVTNIMKPMKRVGSGDAWATESRNHAIDYTQTGNFTVNNIKANTVTATSYGLQKVTVKLNEQTEAMPENTGVILKLPLVGDDDSETSANVANFAKAKNSNEVPLFYPPYSQNIVSYDVVKFGGTGGNLMKENLTEKVFTSETETIDDIDYVPFIFAYRYMTWKKENGELSHDAAFTDGTVPVFYRLHKYNNSTNFDGKTATDLNTLGANKAYLLLRKGNVPDALWKDDPSFAPRHYIGIEGISDMEEMQTATGENQGDGRMYNLKGQVVSSEGQLPSGIYIRNGRKIVVR